MKAIARKASTVAALVAATAICTTGCGDSGRPASATAAAGRHLFVADGARREALVWAAGDGADGGPGAMAVARLVQRARPDLFLYLGDVYPEGDRQGFSQGYAPTFGTLGRITAPTPGNHDWPERRQGYVPYWAKTRGVRPPAYYSFRAGGWEILSLNSEIAHDRRSRQLRWLRAKLRAPGDCRLAFWHRPRFSAASVHGDNPDVDPLWRTLRGHARLVLNGHEHDMQRFRPRDGLVELVDGAGGHSFYGLRGGYRGLAFGNRDSFGAIRLGLRPGAARIAFVDMLGKTLDRSRVRCTASERQPR
jgi:Calcineurin-like phosphoesterase